MNNWINQLVSFFPKSLLNVELIWDIQWERYAIKVYDNYPLPDISYVLLYFDVDKEIYNIVDYSNERSEDSGVFREDLHNLDFACAAFVFYVYHRYDCKYNRKEGEDDNAWDIRRYRWADELFARVDKKFKINETEKQHLYRYGVVTCPKDEIPRQWDCMCYGKNMTLVKVLQRVGENKNSNYI